MLCTGRCSVWQAAYRRLEQYAGKLTAAILAYKLQ